MDKKNITINLGSGGTFLTAIFFAAKVTHYIDWSWIWVFAPLWLPFAIFLGILGGIALGILLWATCSATIDWFGDRKRRKNRRW